jgi:thymidylate kinase
MASRKAAAHATRPFLVSFSGIDGAGKTTQIEQLTLYLQREGFRVTRLSFWDNIAVWSNMRAGVGSKTVGLGHSNETAEHSFSPHNNKHIRKWYLTGARAGFYLLDAARLHLQLARQAIRNSDVVIFDRYIYDQIANIDSQSLAARLYRKSLLKLAPVPDLPFVLDASPDAAFARKPEYPLEFVHRNRRQFLNLQEFVPQLIVVPDANPEEIAEEIILHIRRSRLAERVSTEGKTEVAAVCALVQKHTSCSVREDPTTGV